MEQPQISPPASRRTSAEHMRSSIERERRPSMASLVRETPITEESKRDLDGGYGKELPHGEPLGATQSNPGSKSAQEVLAEMEAFQKEIDALREKFGQGS
jgi:hypothetical protein